MYNNGSLTKNCEAVQMPPLLQLQKLPGKGDGGWGEKKSRFFPDPAEDHEFVETENAFWGIL